MRYRTGNNLRAALLALSFGVLVTLAYSQQPDIPAQDASHPTEQGGPDTLGGAIQDPTAAKRGQKLFSATCGFCHGEDAKGRNGPDLVRSTIVLRDVKGNLIGQVIREGRPQKGMPAFSLTQDQIVDVAAFLHSRTHLAATSVFADDINELPLTGDVKRGEAYFNGPGRCHACHSATLDLAHIAKKYGRAELQSRFLSPPGPEDSSWGSSRALLDEKTKPAVAVIVRLASGEAISGRLLDLNAFDVALVDGSGWYRSYSLADATVSVRDPLESHRELIPKYTDALMHDILAYLETLQ